MDCDSETIPWQHVEATLCLLVGIRRHTRRSTVYQQLPGTLLISLSHDTTSLTSSTSQTWYLGHWASQYETHPAEEVSVAQ